MPSPPQKYTTLDPAAMVLAIADIKVRIEERFPSAGLTRVAQAVADEAEAAQARTTRIAQPNLLLRGGVLLLIAGAGYGIWRIVSLIDFKATNADNVYTILQGIEALMNLVVLMGAALLFLVTVERRLKRRRALIALNALRSLAHVVDMHQLTKDSNSSRTASVATSADLGVPQRPITLYELSRYLHYCSELVAHVGKVAALYAQNLPDDQVVNTVGDIERLTTGLSQKIWQKITITEAKRHEQELAGAPLQHSA